MPRLSPVIAGPSSSHAAAPASRPAASNGRRKRSRHNLPYEHDEEEGTRQKASSSRWLEVDGSGSNDFQAWPRYDQDDNGRRRSSSYGASSSSNRKDQRSGDDANLYDVVARIATSIIQERQQEQQQQRRERRLRPRDASSEDDGARVRPSNSGSDESDDDDDSAASSSSHRSGHEVGSDDSDGSDAQGDQSEDDDAPSKALVTASTLSTSDTPSALIDPLVLSVQSGLETLLASLERRRQKQQEAQGSIGSKRRAGVMSGEDVLEGLQALVGEQRGRTRRLGDGVAEAVGGREVLEAVRERVERRRREMSGRDEAELGEEEMRAAAAAASAAGQEEEFEGHRGVEQGEEEPDGRGQDVTTTGNSQSQQQPPQQPPSGNSASAPRRRRPPSSKQPAAAATWFGDESVKSRKRRLDALLLLG